MARYIIIATGGSAKSLPGVQIDNKQILDYVGALKMTRIPKSIAIVGAGAIGVEFAHLYNRLGSEVTLIEYANSIFTIRR